MTSPRKTRMEEIFEQIPPEAMETVNEKLLGGASAEAISKVLTDHGFPISPTSTKRHRKALRDERSS